MATKKAFLAGINDYLYVSDLRGCVSDVEKFRSLLAEDFQFPPGQIHTLTDDEVVKSNVVHELEWLLKGAKSGDQLVFMFAGHGSQTADLDGDEPDGVDELLCLHDMDFDDPETYLLDDDIYRFTKRLSEGVLLTIIFDCCHSGTATRMLLSPAKSRGLAPNKAPLVDLRSTLQRSSDYSVTRALSLREEGHDVMQRLLEPRTDEEERHTVLARFIEPPAKVLDLMHRKGTRRSMKRSGDAGKRTMNHVFFAASESGQTSADAYIDGGFHGAFSFHFCRAVRTAGIDADRQRLLRDVRTALAQGRFSQVPQLEPQSTTGPLFDGPSAPVATSPATKTPVAPAEETIARPFEQQVLKLLTEIRDQVGPRVAPPHARASGQRALVYVHGICQHDAGYSNGWWAALRPHLSATLASQLENRRLEVLWSQHVSQERTLLRDVAPEPLVRAHLQREQELADYLRDVVADRAHREALQELPPQDRDVRPRAAVVTLDRGLLEARALNCIDDFVKYLLRNTVRREVQREFLDIVRPLLEAGAEIDVMSHSWGTVVAYESLRILDQGNFAGRVLNLFTIGSALSIVPVQRRLETGDYVKPRHVHRWINLDARRDLVGGSLATLRYGVDEEYLNLEPVGCGGFLANPACSHSSYFRAENAAVNRDIFAARMQA